MKSFKLNRISTENISHSVFYGIMTIIAVLFGMFYLVDFNIPYDENPDYKAPLLTGAVIVFVIAYLFAAIIIWLCAVSVSVRKRGREARNVNGIPLILISRLITLFVGVILVVSYITGSTTCMDINGKIFDNIFMLRVADMFIVTVLVMFAMAVLAVALGSIRYIRRRH